MKNIPILIVPGRGNSEPGHWQSILESTLTDTQRVEQDWNVNDVAIWGENIDQTVTQLDCPPLIVAHSFGCLATAYAQIVLGTAVGATLFVAPADPARFGLDRHLFARALTRPGFMVASSSDPWMSLEKALSLAHDWKIDAINLGDTGHINVASGHGHWPFGEALVQRMRHDLAAIRSTGFPTAARLRQQTECRIN